MSEVTVEKDGEQISIPEEDLDLYMTRGWQVPGGRVPRMVSYRDPSTGEIRIRRALVDPESYGAANEYLRGLGGGLVSPTREAQTLYEEQQRGLREQSYAQEVGAVGQVAFSTANRLLFGGISGLTRQVDPERGAQLDESLSILAEQNPGAELTAQLASIGIPLLMGGAGFARAFAGPTGLAMEAGQAIRGASTGLVGRLTAGAVEGGLDLALQEAVEANIRNDYEGLSERMLASGAVGALFGGAVEGGLLYREARASARSANNALGQVSAQQLASQPPGILRRIWDRATELLSGSNPQAFRVRRMGNIAVTDDLAVRAFREVAPEPGRFARGLADDAAEGLAQHRLVAQQLRDARWVQSPRVAQALQNVNPSVGIQAVQTNVADVQQFIRGNNLSGNVATLAKEAEQAAQRGSIQDLLSIREKLRPLQGGKDPLTSQAAESLYRGIDDGLGKIGGDFADLLAKRNQFLEGVDALEMIAGRVFQSPGGVQRINSASMGKILNDFARQGDTQGIEALEQMFGGEALREASQTFGVAIKGMDDAALRSFQERVGKWEAYQQFRNLELQVNSGSGFGATLGISGHAVLAGLGAGAATDDPLTGVGVAVGVAALAKPTGAARLWSSIKSLVLGQDRRIAQAATNVRQSLNGKLLAPSKIAPTTATGRAFLSSDRREREQTYETVASRIEQLIADPQAVFQALEPQVIGADSVNPRLGMKMGEDAHRILGALAEAMPASRRNRLRLPQMPGIRIPPTDNEMDELLEAAAVLEDPVFAADLFAAGRLTNTGARAVERAYPSFYRGMTSAVFQEYADMVERGQMPDFQASIRMGTLFGFSPDPSMDPGVILAFQGSYSQTSEQERAIRSGDTVQRELQNLDSAHRTMSQGLQQ